MGRRTKLSSHSCFGFFAGAVIAFCLGATPFAAAAVAPDADRTFSHPSEDNQTKYLTLAPDTYTFRTDANPNGYHWVEWYDTYSGGSPVATAHLYYYDDTNFNLATSGWVRAEVYKSDFWGNWLGWEAAYRWYVTVTVPKPDLEVTSMEIDDSTASDQHFDPGESVRLDFQGHNDGDATSMSSIRMKWWYGTSAYAKTHEIDYGYLGTVNGLAPDEYEWETDASWSVPTTPGTYWLTVKIDDNNQQTDEKNEDNNEETLRFIVDQPPETISPPTSILGNQATYTNTSNSYTASGASSNLGHSIEYRFKWDDGTYSSWGSATRSHSWSTAGDYYIDAQARCATHTDRVSSWGNISWNVKVLNPPQITVTSPNGGESWQAGTEKTITWNSTETVGADVRIELYKDDSYFGYIVTSTANDGAYTWPIPSNLQAGTTYQVKIIDTSNSSVYDYSNGYFYVTAPPPVDDAEIVTFGPPTGLKERGDQVTTSVRVKNTGNTTRSFWVGLSFAHSTATGASWPEGWYDIQPIKTSILSPGQEEGVSFPIAVAATWRAGQYYAVSRIWDSFNEDFYLMEEPIFDSTLDHPEWVDNPDIGMLSFSLPQISIPDDAKTIMDEFELISMLVEGVGIQELYYQGKKPLFLLKASKTFNVYGGITISVGGGIFIDLADLCELTPEGKAGWTTVWFASDIGALTYNTSEGGNPFEAGIVMHNFDYNERGIADFKNDVLEFGKFTVPGICFTLAKYDDHDGFQGPSWDWCGTKKVGVTVENAHNVIDKIEIRTVYIRTALLGRSDIQNQNISIADYVGYVCDIFADYENNPTIYDDFTYDDGAWPVEQGQPQTSLKMRRVDNSWMNSAHHFALDVPAGATNLTFSTSGGTGDVALLWRFGSPVHISSNGFDDHSYHTGTTVEILTIPDPLPGKHYVALSVGTSAL